MSHNGYVSDLDVSADGLPKRTAGRPRSAETSQAILEAAIELIAEHGSIQGLSMEAVAARSGVSKATIYRRWGNRDELVAAAFETIKAKPLDFAHTSLRDDLMHLATSVPASLSPCQQRVLEVVLRESESSEYLRDHHDAWVVRRRQAAREMLRYWVERGELRPDVDVAVAAAMVTSTMRSVLGFNQVPDLRVPDLADRVVDHLLRGITA